MKVITRLFLAAALGLYLVTGLGAAQAEDLSIVDPLGLLRVVHDATTPQMVRVKLKIEKGAGTKSGMAEVEQLILTQEGGVVPDISGEKESAAQWLFKAVTKGNWRLTFRGQVGTEVTVIAVEVVE